MHQPNLLGTSCVFASVSVFLSDPVIPGVRSMGQSVSNKLYVVEILAILATLAILAILANLKFINTSVSQSSGG